MGLCSMQKTRRDRIGVASQFIGWYAGHHIIPSVPLGTRHYLLLFLIFLLCRCTYGTPQLITSPLYQPLKRLATQIAYLTARLFLMVPPLPAGEGAGERLLPPYRVPNGTPQCSLSCGAPFPILQSIALYPPEHCSLSSSA